MRSISILGCGWLGLPLAKSLIKKGYIVKGSTTSIEKISILKNEGIIPYKILILKNEIEGDIDALLGNSEILILDIPPKLRMDSKENFVAKIVTLIQFIENSGIEKILFVSSTSVYPDEPLTLGGVTENTVPNPDSENGKQLLKAEQFLLNHPNFKTIVLRFGGLIGPDRHPITYLAGRKNIENPEAPVNMIHQEDCIGIIKKIIHEDEKNNLEWNTIFNVVAPFHPTRKEYYCKKALEMGLAKPEFVANKTSKGKFVLSQYVVDLLNYEFFSDYYN